MHPDELADSGLQISGRDARPEDLKPHSDLTYRNLVELNVSGTDVQQSLLTGSLIRRCVWTKIKFQRSDFDGVRAEQSTFVECDFSICDIRSSHFVECKFLSCIFNDAFVDDCDFYRCELKGCSFQGSSLTRCRFADSSIDRCTITPGTFLHNRLYRCAIVDMLLGDASVSYVILRECKLERVTLNAESIGGLFGLTLKQVREAKLVFLGKQEPIPSDADVIALASAEYSKRRWYVGELVLALNFGLLSVVGAVEKYLSSAYPRFVEMGFAKGDEVQFVGDILEELANLDKLPLLGLMNVLEWCAALETAVAARGEVKGESSDDALRTLAGRASLIVGRQLNKLENAISRPVLPKDDADVILEATFHYEPSIALYKLMNSINAFSALKISHKNGLVRAEAGSYREIVSTTVFSVFALQLFLFLVNGCVIQLTELKQRVKVLARKKGPRTYRELALIPTQQTTPVVLRTLQELSRFAKGVPWLPQASLGGFDASNIQKLEILEQRKRPSRSKS